MFSLFITSCNSQEVETVKEEMRAVPKTELSEMIGQMIMVGFKGMEADSLSDTFLHQLEKGEVGGIILFDYDIPTKSTKRNIKSPEQVKVLIAGLNKKVKIPLFVAVDQEGGKVNRLKTKYGFPQIVSAAYLGKLDNIDSTKHYATLNANNLKQLGFNLNFAPVVDMNINPDNPVIGKYERSFSKESDMVIKHSAEWIKAHHAVGILSTLKHFPGHGSSDADSHKGVTDITNYWSAKELIPFKEVLAMDYSIGIMTAHVVNNQLDSIYPATMSDKIISKILRDEWKFEGLIFSDDLQMKAVNEIYPFETIIEKSILAGVDVLVFGNNLEYDESIPTKAIEIITKLVEDGTISRERIEASYDRIMEEKGRLK
jgi:beta-N-acetylhexosaminidase